MKKQLLPLLIFTAPALISFILIMLIPMGVTFYYSFTNWNMLNPDYNFVGFKNYIEAIFDDYGFRNSIFFTFKYAITLGE